MFLTASGRALGPDRFTQISVLWAVLFLVGNGLYIPVEQELGRSIAARRARGIGYGSLVRRVTIAACVTFAVVAAVMAAFGWKIADALFRGNETPGLGSRLRDLRNRRHVPGPGMAGRHQSLPQLRRLVRR